MEYHEYAGIFPLLEGREFTELCNDIKANGLRVPIVLHPDGRILDGRNRYRACVETGIEPRFETWDGNGLATDFVNSLNATRRHETDGQKVISAGKYAAFREQEARERQLSSLRNVGSSVQVCTNEDFGRSREKAAEKFGLGERTVASAVKVVKSGADELIEAVESGKVSVSAAADVATLPKAEQAVIVARGEKEILEAAKQIRAEKAEVKKAERVAEVTRQIQEISAATPRAPSGLFHVISIDPPWPYDDGNSAATYDPNGRRAANPYPEMTLEQIASLDIPAAEDCVLWLWTTHKFMRHSFALLDGWGFEDKAILTWAKDRMGLGRWLRSQSEFCIMAVRGSPVINLTNQTTILRGPLREHSRKPDEFYDMVDSLCVGRKLDFFSREPRDGWEQFGNDKAKFA